MLSFFYLVLVSCPTPFSKSVTCEESLPYGASYSVWEFMKDIYTSFCFILFQANNCEGYRADIIYPHLTRRDIQVDRSFYMFEATKLINGQVRSESRPWALFLGVRSISFILSTSILTYRKETLKYLAPLSSPNSYQSKKKMS